MKFYNIVKLLSIKNFEFSKLYQKFVYKFELRLEIYILFIQNLQLLFVVQPVNYTAITSIISVILCKLRYKKKFCLFIIIKIVKV